MTMTTSSPCDDCLYGPDHWVPPSLIIAESSLPSSMQRQKPLTPRLTSRREAAAWCRRLCTPDMVQNSWGASPL